MAGYLTRSLKKWPEVILKLAISADSMIGRLGEGQVTITGPVSRAQVHLMRAESDAILVGINTAIADNPELTVRLRRTDEDARRSGSCSIPVRGCQSRPNWPKARLKTPVWLAACGDADAAARSALQRAGIRILAAELYDGRLALPELLDDLAGQGVSTVLVEGGAETARAFLIDNLVDRIVLFRGPGTVGAGGVPAPISAEDDTGRVPGLSAGGAFRRRQLQRMGEAALMFTGIVTDVGTVGKVSPLPEGIGCASKPLMTRRRSTLAPPFPALVCASQS